MEYEKRKCSSALTEVTVTYPEVIID